MDHSSSKSSMNHSLSLSLSLSLSYTHTHTTRGDVPHLCSYSILGSPSQSKHHILLQREVLDLTSPKFSSLHELSDYVLLLDLQYLGQGLPWWLWLYLSKVKMISGTSLVVQWLRLHASTAGGCGFNAWLGNLRSYILHSVAKKKKKSLKAPYYLKILDD